MPDDMERKSKTAPPDETDEAGRRTSGNDIARRTWDDPARPPRPTARYDKTGNGTIQDETQDETKDETDERDDKTRR